jgi:HPt (histidine-containing phosphotransfer) domain-containing protein
MELALNKIFHFDTEALTLLEEIMGDDFSELIQVFVVDSDPRVSAMRCALEEKNSLALREIAHSFKGASSNLSALPLADICFKIEENARHTNLEGMSSLIAAIDAEYQAVKSILLSLIK